MNIVFDLGGVVFRWQPQKLISSVYAEPETQRLIMAEIIGHNDWQEFDRGTITQDLAITRGAERTGLGENEISRFFEAVPRSLTPILETIELIESFANSGHRLYVLSNMPQPLMEYLEAEYDIWHNFHGTTISSRINLIKPELAIYEHLLATHNLNAEETVFIDDMDINVKAAATLGIQTIRFLDTEQCRHELTALQCL